MSRRQPGLFDPTEDERRAGVARMHDEQRRKWFAWHFRAAGHAIGARGLLAAFFLDAAELAELDRVRRVLPGTVEYAADLWCNALRNVKAGKPARGPAVLSVDEIREARS